MSRHRIHNRRSGTRFEAAADETVLAAALRQGVGLAHQCRSGRCGRCAARVLAGQVVEAPAPDDPLGAASRAAGRVLLCRARARSDLVIEAAEAPAGRPVLQVPVRVSRVAPLARDVMGLWLRPPPGVDLGLAPGQYVDLVWPGGRRRSYSPASAQGELELHVRRVAGGWFSERLFGGAVKARDLLRLEAPFGALRARPADPRPVILMAGGTGIAPVYAILKALAAGRGAAGVHLFWGVREARDLYLEDALRPLLGERGWAYTPVLSEPAGGWRGARGRVHEAVCGAYGDLSGHLVYAAGPPAMVEAGAAAFAARGLAPEDYLADGFYYAAEGPDA